MCVTMKEIVKLLMVLPHTPFIKSEHFGQLNVSRERRNGDNTILLTRSLALKILLF